MSEEKDPKKQYISLQEASSLCRYSQEYLSLRARQGKLKAIKLGRNWVTTKNWLDNYLEVAEEYNLKINGNGHKKPEIFQLEDIASPKENLPPKNLPIGEVKIRRVKSIWAIALSKIANFFEGEINEAVFHIKRLERSFDNLTSQPKLVFKAQISLAVVLLSFGIFIQKDYFASSAIFARESIGSAFSAVVGKSFSASLTQIKIQAKDSFYAEVVSDTAKTFSDYFSWASNESSKKASLIANIIFPEEIRKDFGFVFEKSKNGFSFLSGSLEKAIYFSSDEIGNGTNHVSKIAYSFSGNIFDSAKNACGRVFGFFENIIAKIANELEKFICIFYKKRAIVQRIENEKDANGIIVMPSTGKESEDNKIKKEIKDNFSDEVKVEIKDEVSGIITPVFKNGNGENYLYMMVPLDKK